MKSKKLMILFTILAFAILAFVFTPEVHADTYENNSIIKVKTTIRNWSKDNYLNYNANTNSIPGVTKSVYLTDGYNTTVDITNLGNVDLGADGNYSTIRDFHNGDDLEGLNNFSEGSTVYLYEKYDFSEKLNQTNYSSPLNYTENIAEISLGSLTYDSYYDIINANAMKNYNSNSIDSITAYMDVVYGTEDPSQNSSSNIVKYLYTQSGGEKTSELDLGEIIIPRFDIYMNLEAKGNLLGSGYFRADMQYWDELTGNVLGWSEEDEYWYKSDNTSKIYNRDYGFTTTESLANALYGFNYYYKEIGKDDGYDLNVSRTGWDDNELRASYNSDYGTYKLYISGTIEEHRDVPNGIFYNILPYAIAIALASIGVIILKKHSVKE